LPDKSDDADNTAGDEAASSLQTQQMLKLANYRMPFGKYKGQLLIDLPEPYVVWFAKQGFPKGELGVMLGILYEIKLNGLEYLFKPLRRR
jgi:uncharacterized protein